MHLKSLRSSLAIGSVLPHRADVAPAPESFVLQTGWVETIILYALTSDDPVFVSKAPDETGGGCP